MRAPEELLPKPLRDKRSEKFYTPWSRSETSLPQRPGNKRSLRDDTSLLVTEPAMWTALAGVA
jgi:hypothetical protein